MSSAMSRRVLDQSLSRRASLRLTAAVGAGLLIPSQLRPALAQDATPSAGAPPELVITSSEYAFEMPATTASGYNRITLNNQGAEDHHALFLRFNEDTTEEQFMEALMSGDLLALLDVVSAYGGAVASPGGSGTVIAWLDPGMYAVICVIPDAEGVPHVAHGMMSMLEVTDEAGTGSDPTADGTITLVEMAFEGLPAEVPAGQYVWEVVNGGTQLHELVVMQLAPGVPAQAIIGAMTAPPASPEAAAPAEDGPPPFVAGTGAAPMSPGATNYLEFDAQPGEYIAICFVPDTETGMPHAMMGMIGAFTVV